MAGPQRRQPSLDVIEHAENAAAKRAFLVGLADTGGSYVSPSVADFPVKGRAALEVILVNTAGDLYDATGGGGGSSDEVIIKGWTTATGFANVLVQTMPTMQGEVAVAALPTLHADIVEANGSDIRAQTFYVPPVSGGAARQVPSISNLFGGCALKSIQANSTQIFVGPADVTTFASDGSVGAIIEPGEVAAIPVDSSGDLYVIADGTATLVMSVLAVLR